MSDLIWERVFPMPPLSVRAIGRLAEEFLAIVCPQALVEPSRLDVVHLVEHVLPHSGIHVGPATVAELGGREGATDPESEDGINILILDEQWRALIAGGRRSHRARATTLHEVGHAVLHVPVLRRMGQFGFQLSALSRVSRGAIPAFRDPEWQAWAFAGAVLAPRRTLAHARWERSGVAEMAEFYGLSITFMTNHMRRLRLID